MRKRCIVFRGPFVARRLSVYSSLVRLGITIIRSSNNLSFEMGSLHKKKGWRERINLWFVQRSFVPSIGFPLSCGGCVLDPGMAGEDERTSLFAKPSMVCVFPVL